MAIIAPYLAKFCALFPAFDSRIQKLEAFLEWPLLPTIHITLTLILGFVTVCLFRKSYKNKSASTPKASNDQILTKVEHLVWINSIISWLFLSSSSQLPYALKAWIEDLNLFLASQKRNHGALIYGLREGSALPMLVEVKEVERVGKDLQAQVLLRTSQFGFLVSIKEDQPKNGFSSSNFSAIVTHFESWFLLVLSQSDDSFGISLKSTEAKPISHFNMKPLSAKMLAKVKPEVVAQAIQEAVLSTPISVKLNVVKEGKYESDSEKSCIGDTEDENTESAQNDVMATSSTIVLQPATNFTNAPLTLSTPGKSAESSGQLRGSVGSLNNITRTPSGRGPAKPIRLREKSLVINDIRFKSENSEKFFPIIGIFELDHPHQKKSTLLFPDSFRNKLKFDLSSRSSRLKVMLQSSDSSQESMNTKGSLAIDWVSLESKTPVEIELEVGEEAAVLELELHVQANQESNAGLPNGAKNNRWSMGPDSLKPEDRDQNLETKVTTVTVTRSPSHSPAKESLQPDNDSQGVSFNTSSVAETALMDLSRKKSPANKTKISIIAVERNITGNETEDVESGASDEAPPEIRVEPPAPSSVVPIRKKSSSAKVRRTRSLIFGNSKKSKDQRYSTLESGIESSQLTSSPALATSASSASLYRKNKGFARLFGKKKKTAGNEVPEKAMASFSSEVTQTSPAKVKRSRSFKSFMKGKKKSE